MIASIGPVVFDLITGLEGIRYQQDSSFARHDVVGSSPIYEDVGDGEKTIKVSGCIYPEAIGTNGGYASLEAARSARLPMPFMLGDFSALGWVVISNVERIDDNLGETGVGREIKFTATLLRVGRPTALSVIASILRFL